MNAAVGPGKQCLIDYDRPIAREMWARFSKDESSMPSWSAVNAHRLAKAELSVAVGREFERRLLPLLHVIWRNLTRPPSLGKWDQKGVDLVEWAEQGPLPVVVQCKGLEVQELEARHLVDIRKSIASFRKSGRTANLFVLAHNRLGKDRSLHAEIDTEVQWLVRDGIAEKGEVWSLETIVDNVFDAMAGRIDMHLAKSASELLDRMERLSEFRIPFIGRVPMVESELVFKRHEPCATRSVAALSLRPSNDLIASASDSRWTLLVGVFGAGKTTSALHAATSGSKIPIFVQAKALHQKALRSGTGLFLLEVLRTLNIHESLVLDDDIPSQILYLLEKIAGSVLGVLLRNPHSKYLLVVDGLDENRVYCTLEGIQHLSNQLAELRCPILLTTRREHLSEQFGNFSLAFTEASAKYSPKRTARLLEMAPWDRHLVSELVKRALVDRGGGAAERLNQFFDLVQTGDYVTIYGEMPTNPLFLGFILEDVIDVGVRRRRRSEIIKSWVIRKIWRDRSSVERLVPDQHMDVTELVGRILEVLRRVARGMVLKKQADGDFMLLESVSDRDLSEIASGVFGTEGRGVLPILLNSVLVPLGYRNERGLRVAFVYQILQEYFLAESLVVDGEAPDRYPSEVHFFHSDIQQSVPEVATSAG